MAPSPEYCLANREKYISYSRERYKENPDKAKQIAKKHRERNGDAIRAKERARYAERREEMQANARKKYAKNRESCIETVRKWQRGNPEKVTFLQRRRHLWRWYRMTLEDWDALFSRQGNCCAICKSPTPVGQKHWHVDHDHSTGDVRGILCYCCNMLLGMAKDSKQTLQGAITYLDMTNPA